MGDGTVNPESIQAIERTELEKRIFARRSKIIIEIAKSQGIPKSTMDSLERGN